MQAADKKAQKLNSKIEEKIKLIESGKAKGKSYTPKEYLEHIDKVLED